MKIVLFDEDLDPLAIIPFNSRTGRVFLHEGRDYRFYVHTLPYVEPCALWANSLHAHDEAYAFCVKAQYLVHKGRKVWYLVADNGQWCMLLRQVRGRKSCANREVEDYIISQLSSCLTNQIGD